MNLRVLRGSFPISDVQFRKVVQHPHCPCPVKEEREYGTARPGTPLTYQVCGQNLASKQKLIAEILLLNFT